MAWYPRDWHRWATRSREVPDPYAPGGKRLISEQVQIRDVGRILETAIALRFAARLEKLAEDGYRDPCYCNQAGALADLGEALAGYALRGELNTFRGSQCSRLAIRIVEDWARFKRGLRRSVDPDPPPPPQAPDTAPGPYYVTARRSDGATVPLLGPFDLHAAALAAVDRGREIARKLDPRAPWYSYGTVRLRETPPGEAAPRGILNDRAPELFA